MYDLRRRSLRRQLTREIQPCDDYLVEPSILAVALAAVGCGGGTANVSGVVTLDGKPVEGATVTFTPDSKDGGGVGASYGKTDAQGRFSLRTDVRRQVRRGRRQAQGHDQSSPVSDPSNPEGIAKELIPAHYNTKSDLTFDVTSGGTDKANFELKK